jgi:hypothetical protein
MLPDSFGFELLALPREMAVATRFLWCSTTICVRSNSFGNRSKRIIETWVLNYAECPCEISTLLIFGRSCRNVFGHWIICSPQAIPSISTARLVLPARPPWRLPTFTGVASGIWKRQGPTSKSIGNARRIWKQSDKPSGARQSSKPLNEYRGFQCCSPWTSR